MPTNLGDERDQLWRALQTNSDRITELETKLDERKEFMKTTIETAVKTAVEESMPRALLNDEEHRWVQIAIKNEAQKVDFRRAVIEKTFTGLVWVLIIGIGVILKEYFTSHGWRP